MKSLIAGVLLVVTCAAAQDVRLTARTDSSSYLIGQWMHLRVDARVTGRVVDIHPLVGDSIGMFEILAIDSSSVPDGDGFVRSWTFRLTAFDTGRVDLPGIDFRYRTVGEADPRIASTSPVALTLRGLDVDPQADIKDIKPLLYAPWLFEDYLPYLLLIGVLAILAAGGYYAWKRWKRRPVPVEPQVVHIVPPHEEALAALRILEEKKLWQQGKVKEFYSEVTEIVRRYLSARFSILALEMTSDEILQQLKRVPQAQTALKNLQSFLTTADLVKFAKYRPTPEEHSHEMELAYAIVRSMVPRTESVPTEEKVMADAG